MMFRNFCVVLTTGIFFSLAVIGCSGGGAGPVAPMDSPDTQVSDKGAESSRVLWGIWDLHFDPVEMEITAIPDRSADIHVDVTDFLIPPACDDCVQIAVNSFDPVTRILDVDVTLRNPTPINGRDVRGILYTNEAGHELRNADDWTNLWDIPGGMDINPFRAFAKEVENRIFSGGAENTENYLVYIPQPPQYASIRYAVDASWPGNCREPYSIDNFTQLNELYQVSGASAHFEMDVFDWQDDVDDVMLMAPEITGEDVTHFTFDTGTNWILHLTNGTGAVPGDYDVLLSATSPNGQGAILHDFVTITVTEALIPEVTGIDPDGGMIGMDLTGVTVTGNNFKGPLAQVLIEHHMTPPIVATNVVVMNISTVTCDISISLGAQTGLHDVRVINDTGLSGVGTELFEIFPIGPFFPKDITPPDLNFCPWEVAVSGNYAYVAGGVCGLHIFDITDPSDPVWVNRVITDRNANSVAVSGGYAYMGETGTFEIVDINPPEDAYIVKTISQAGFGNAVVVEGDYAYVAHGGAGLMIVDINPPEEAEVYDLIDTPGSAQDVAVSGGYAYIADQGEGLQIIDIDPLDSAAIVHSVSFPGYVKSVAVYGDYAYSGNTMGHLYIVDINPPESATEVNSVAIAGGIYGIHVDGEYAYLTDFESSFNVVDINPPGTASVVDTLTMPGCPVDLAVSGDYAYVADYNAGLLVVDISTIGSADITGFALTPGNALGVTLSGDYVYVGNEAAGMNIVDINPPDGAYIVNTIDPPGDAFVYGLTTAGSYAYVPDGNYLHIVDITDPLSAGIDYSVALPDFPWDAAISNGYAFVAASYIGMHIVDIDPPGSASLVDTIDTPNSAHRLAVHDGYAYVADKSSGLQIIDIDPIGTAAIVHAVDTPGTADDVAISGDYAYVADRLGGLQIIDINPPESASIYNSVDMPNYAEGVAISGNYAYVACNRDGLQIVDIEFPGSAAIVSSLELPYISVGVLVSDNMAYLANSEGGLRIVKLW